MTLPFEWTKAQVVHQYFTLCVEVLKYRNVQAAGASEPSMLGALLQDHDLTSGLGTEERDDRLKELGLAIYAGEPEAIRGIRSCNWTDMD
jgi:hypothetical protein